MSRWRRAPKRRARSMTCTAAAVVAPCGFPATRSPAVYEIEASRSFHPKHLSPSTYHLAPITYHLSPITYSFVRDHRSVAEPDDPAGVSCQHQIVRHQNYGRTRLTI